MTGMIVIYMTDVLEKYMNKLFTLEEHHWQWLVGSNNLIDKNIPDACNIVIQLYTLLYVNHKVSAFDIINAIDTNTIDQLIDTKFTFVSRCYTKYKRQNIKINHRWVLKEFLNEINKNI
jgi:hypothetical protein